MDNPLLSCRVKIERARKHVLDLKAAIAGLNGPHAEKGFTEDYTDEFTCVFRVGVIKPMPVEFSCFIGDAIHNLMSALDALAVALVRRENPQATEGEIKSTYFPIKEKGPRPTSGEQTFLSRISPEAAAIVQRIQAYPGGQGELLCTLRDLNIIDKHRTILTLTSLFRHAAVLGAAPGAGFYEPAPSPPFKNGDEIGRWIGNYPRNCPAIQFTAFIVFDEAGLAKHRAVLTILEDFINVVERTVKVFAANVFEVAG